MTESIAVAAAATAAAATFGFVVTDGTEAEWAVGGAPADQAGEERDGTNGTNPGVIDDAVGNEAEAD